MKIAVSACLLGQNVRYDGGNKHERFITDELGRYAELIPFCPEDAVFSTPRGSVRLVDKDGTVRVLTNSEDEDLTQRLLDGSRGELDKIAAADIGGIIFKARSPSCGMGTTPLYIKDTDSGSKTYGVFAAMCKEKFPYLPMIEESGLQDETSRENFTAWLLEYDSINKSSKCQETDKKALRELHVKYASLVRTKDEKIYI